MAFNIFDPEQGYGRYVANKPTIEENRQESFNNFVDSTISPASQLVNASIGDVMGAADTNVDQQQTNQQTNQQPTGGGGGDTGGGSPQPSGPSERELFLQELNAVYNPIMAHLSQSRQRLEGQKPKAIADLKERMGREKETAGRGKESSLRKIGELGHQAGEQKEDAISSARRMYQDLRRSGQQRFGQASSAGEAFSEITGREQQRRFGEIQREHLQTERQLVLQEQEIEDNYQNAVLQIDQRTNDAIREVNQSFQDKMFEIDKMESMAESEKAGERLNALRDMRDKAYAVRVQDRQFKQQLSAQAQSLAMEIQAQKDLNAGNYNTAINTLQNYGQELQEGAGTDIFAPTDSYSGGYYDFGNVGYNPFAGEDEEERATV